MSRKSKSRAAASQSNELQDALEHLTPEQAELFVQALELAMRKRRLMLLGYLSAVVAIVVGMVTALLVYGTREPGAFMEWVFLIPFFCAGALIMGFGRLAKRLSVKD